MWRNESPEKIKFLFLSNSRVSLFTQDVSLNIKTKYCPWTLLTPTLLTPTLKTGKTGVDLTIMDEKIE